MADVVGGEGLVVHQPLPNKAIINSWMRAMRLDVPKIQNIHGMI